MDQNQLLRYMIGHYGWALIGKEETLQSCESLESRGMIIRVGDYDGKPVFHITDKGAESMKSPAQKFLEGSTDIFKKFSDKYDKRNRDYGTRG